MSLIKRLKGQGEVLQPTPVPSPTPEPLSVIEPVKPLESISRYNLILKEPLMITLNDLLTSSNTYPERFNSNELTEEFKNNGKMLLDAVNSLLRDLNYDKDTKVSSGFRPSEVNAGVLGAAKKSLHMICKAIDILDDKNQSLALLIKSRPDLLRKYNLFLENPNYTKGKYTNWVHLDIGNRSDRPSRMFNP